MTKPTSFRNLSDQQLLSELKSLVQRERELLMEILKFLFEVERRQLFLSRGYPSLFAFCMGELAYSESQAHTRIQAMRLVKSVPEAAEKMESGALSLSVAAAAQSAFRRSQKLELPVSPADKKTILASLSNLSTRNAEQILLERMPASAVPIEKTKPVTSQLTRIEFNADAALMQKLEKLKNLTAHKNYEGQWDTLFSLLADIGLRHLTSDPNKNAKLKNSASNDAALLGTSQVDGGPQRNLSRHIPAVVKRHVWNRDGGRCQYRDPVSGRICSSEHAIQFDHRHKFSEGGDHKPENLRLLCAAHNQWREQ